MKFENNWARSPFKDHMYDPVLKLHMRDMAGQGRPTTDDDASFVIISDPSIELGHYSRAPTPEEVEHNIKYAPKKTEWYTPPDPYRPVPYDSPLGKNILTGDKNFERFRAIKAPLGSVLRVKMHGFNGTSTGLAETAVEVIGYRLGYLKKFASPPISTHPKEFFLYAYMGYIQMPSLLEANGEGILYKEYQDIKCVELCLHADVMRQVFYLSPEDYPEVETQWHCLARSDWPAKEVQK